MAANVDLWMQLNDVYHHALSIPVSYFEHDNIQGVYYYIVQEACLLDPDLMDMRTSDASAISTSQGKFREDVTARDGTCVMTGTGEGFQVCHIIPHAKGHQVCSEYLFNCTEPSFQAKYMINLAKHRHEAFNPPLNDINDIRNGILLALQLHDAFGASQVAFLQTPNFAMTVNDMDLVMQPSAAQVGFIMQPSIADKRLTFQHFNTHDIIWPPPLIFDVAYGCAALKTWGVAAFTVLARNHTEDIYYDNGCNDDNHGGGDNVCSQQKRDRDARAANRQTKFGWQASDITGSQSPDFADMILGLWMQNARKGLHKAHAMKADRTREKVQTWLESAE
ncbi:hypothetical protein L208DRAFT_1422326 [Tricholoma matsutake]|nr:hypothetical protein L208DRAFT_1422326 [Tricholoma matsutake 945]